MQEEKKKKIQTNKAAETFDCLHQSEETSFCESAILPDLLQSIQIADHGRRLLLIFLTRRSDKDSKHGLNNIYMYIY